MVSKWGDVANTAASFHLQSKLYDNIRPPSFGSHPEIRSVVHERERECRPTLSDVDAELAAQAQADDGSPHHGQGLLPEVKRRTHHHCNSSLSSSKTPKIDSTMDRNLVMSQIEHHDQMPESTNVSFLNMNEEENSEGHVEEIKVHVKESSHDNNDVASPHSPLDSTGCTTNTLSVVREEAPLAAAPSNDETIIASNISLLTVPAALQMPTEQTSLLHQRTITPQISIRSLMTVQEEYERDTVGDSSVPSLFLQELCHRLSLLSAVAMASLRNVDQSCDLPLAGYTPGEPWPPVDPDDLSKERRREFHESSRVFTFGKFVFGLTRSNRHRTLYSYARPFRVLGGVSDAEMARLKCARGDHAQVMLAEFWLQEFLIKEQLHKSFGDVAPPIVSRLFQEVSNGTLFYSQARKVVKIPFPFPHAQLTSLFVFILGIVIPFLYLSWSNYLWFGLMMNFFTVLCFVGMHEVARELENPFQNAPNDIPLMTMQAELNEALIQLQSGYHPDSYWSIS
jgi:hypothetical protein